MIKTKRKHIPKWVSEHIELDKGIADIIRSTMKRMQVDGRARNIIEVHHSGKMFLQFERKASLKFKKVINV
jgi:hypothetical protein